MVWPITSKRRFEVIVRDSARNFWPSRDSSGTPHIKIPCRCLPRQSQKVNATRIEPVSLVLTGQVRLYYASLVERRDSVARASLLDPRRYNHTAAQYLAARSSTSWPSRAAV